MGIQIGIMNQAFGADSLKTSVQMVWQIIAPVSLNIGELQIATVFGGLLALLFCETEYADNKREPGKPVPFCSFFVDSIFQIAPNFHSA